MRPVSILLAALVFVSACRRDDTPTTAATSTTSRLVEPRLVVHEWGTFTTFSAARGENLVLEPPGNDLPSFVHERNGPKGTPLDHGRITVSMETPVVYFHAAAPLDVALHVELPHGKMTDIYPRATVSGGVLDWPHVRVLAREDAGAPPTVPGPQRYYEARATSASPVLVGTETEKFLFYRGVGDFAPPLHVQANDAGASLIVENRTSERVESALVVTVHGNAVRFVRTGALAAHAPREITLPGAVHVDTEATGTAALEAAVEEMLVARGLFADEAKAMIATWKTDWFGEEGTRVLHLVPPGETERLLPMRITPTPTDLVRVLVARHDILLPADERALRRLAREGGHDAVRRRLGRFASGAIAELRL